MFIVILGGAFYVSVDYMYRGGMCDGVSQLYSLCRVPLVMWGTFPVSGISWGISCPLISLHDWTSCWVVWGLM